MLVIYVCIHILSEIATYCLNFQERGSVPLHDRLDETVSYIRGLQERIEGLKERKQQLLSEEGSSQGAMRQPHIEVQDHGAGLQVVITGSPGDWFVFNQAIRVIEEDGVEIVSANFSEVGDKAIHVIHLLVSCMSMWFLYF